MTDRTEFHSGAQVVIKWSRRNAVVRCRHNEHGYMVKPYGSRREVFMRNDDIEARHPETRKGGTP